MKAIIRNSAFIRSSAKTKAVAAIPLGSLDEYNLKTVGCSISYENRLYSRVMAAPHFGHFCS
jgi:hypothetical protein